MRVIVCGSRSIGGEKAIELIGQAIEEAGWNINEMISGDADGVDSAAREYAKRNGIDFAGFPANWKGRNKAAGYLTNHKMAWYAKVAKEILQLKGVEEIHDKFEPGTIAIWNGTSKGTQHMIDISAYHCILTYVKLVRPQKESDEA